MSCLHVYSILHIYCLFRKSPTCRIIPSYRIIRFWKKCQPADLFHPAGLFDTIEYFLSHLKYLPHILIEKVVLIQENPKFSITKTVNSSFLILPSTELDFFNYFSFLTFARIPGNQNLRLLVSFLFLFWNSHSEND